jgi:putative nucleotidyltransferase with HDIG domain
MLPTEMKKEINLSVLQQAAMLHDYGKVLIPEEILNKKGALTPEEKKIMELHSEFGYELLKQQGVNEEVLNLIKYHHQKPDGSGYPVADKNFEYSISSQILEAADMYSAITEERPYHKASTKEQALEIIYEEVKKGVICREVFEALRKST